MEEKSMFDFDKITDRSGTYSIKWKVPEGELPMWVADMDFETAPAIKEAIQKKVSHGILGYTYVPEEWNEAYRSWWSTRHHLEIDPDWLVYSTGVIPSVSTAIRRFTAPGEKVLLQTPVYNAFFHCIQNNGRCVAESPLIYDRENRTYTIDFEDLDQKLSDPQTTMMIICNPHNPTGRIWTKEELARMGSLARKHDVLVISDEIHCDMTAPGKEYTSYFSAGEECLSNGIMLISPTKCFNIPGIPTSAAVIPNVSVRERFTAALHNDCCGEANALAVEAVLAAFGESAPWIDALREYIEENKMTVKNYLQKEVPEVFPTHSESTYLLWLDCMDVTEDAKAFGSFLRKEAGLFLCEGSMYGEAGRQFMRFNTACPREMLMEGLLRFKKGVRLWLEQAG